MARPGEGSKKGKKTTRSGLSMEDIRLKSVRNAPPVRTLADMTEPEICELEKHYGCPVVRPMLPT